MEPRSEDFIGEDGGTGLEDDGPGEVGFDGRFGVRGENAGEIALVGRVEEDVDVGDVQIWWCKGGEEFGEAEHGGEGIGFGKGQFRSEFVQGLVDSVANISSLSLITWRYTLDSHSRGGDGHQIGFELDDLTGLFGVIYGCP